MRRLLASGLLPRRAGQPVKALVHIHFAELCQMDQNSALQDTWIAAYRAQWAAHRAAARCMRRAAACCWRTGRLSRDTHVGPLPVSAACSLFLTFESAVPDRDSCNLLTLVATMIMGGVQALLLARDRFHSL